MSKKIVLSGMQPTGELHLGNYLSALKNFVNLQDKYQCYFFIASYHSITIDYDPKIKKQQIIDLAKTYLAAGLDPQKCIIFDQIDVPQHLELYWIFNTLTPIGEAERMTQFKDKASKNTKNINLGLLTYPILQAADILIYKANTVPVGIDQVQHLELTRKIARWFNNRFGTYFPEPEPLLTHTPKIQSLQHPEKKMSKSDGPNSYLGILDNPETIRKKIKKAITGTGQEPETPPGAQNLLNILQELGATDIADKYRKQIQEHTVRYGEMKEEIAEIIIKHFTPLRENFQQIEDSEVEKVLDLGGKQAKEIADQSLREIKKLIGVR